MQGTPVDQVRVVILMGDLRAVVMDLNPFDNVCSGVGDLALAVPAVVLNIEDTFDVLCQGSG